MKKEIVVAIFIGFFIGAIAALIVTNLPKLTNSIKFQTVVKTPTPTISNMQETFLNPDINIDSPKDEFVSDTKSIEITGRVNRGKTILVESLDDQITLEASDSGSFKTKMNLREGANKLHLTVYDQSGNSNTKTLDIYYTTEKL